MPLLLPLGGETWGMDRRMQTDRQTHIDFIRVSKQLSAQIPLEAKFLNHTGASDCVPGGIAVSQAEPPPRLCWRGAGAPGWEGVSGGRAKGPEGGAGRSAAAARCAFLGSFYSAVSNEHGAA